MLRGLMLVRSRANETMMSVEAGDEQERSEDYYAKENLSVARIFKNEIGILTNSI